MLKVLSVAEKNDAAKNIARIMSNGNSRMRDGFSKFNKIYEFETQLFNQRCIMIMTSVSGHLLSLDFTSEYRSWQNVSPVELFDANVEKKCPDDFANIKRTLEREARSCSKLIIWTDCDREGENIGFEIIDVCTAVKRNLDVYRAVFSEITQPSISRAIRSLNRPNKLVSDAVDARMELDLRIGASFTRFQTLRLQKQFPNLSESVISYGSCQFPTLGFVVERFKQREEFQAEPFWKLIVYHKKDEDKNQVEFTWERGRLFDHASCYAFYSIITHNPLARVVDVKTKPKSKWRPVALDTIELEKSASRKLKINAKETMKTAEKLYTKGYISYPRTETNIFPKDFNLVGLVEQQLNNPNWGDFAGRVLQNGPNPRNGSKSDQAHPPIHPLKHANDLSGTEARIYEFIVRHFLACCSEDAKGQETTITIDVNEEKFTSSGLMITERNYLEVYTYERWSDKEIPVYQQGETFTPTQIEMKEGSTVAPPLLTEADLISLMEKHGIGTDATHAEHIETIKERSYAKLDSENRFLPCDLGLGLVEGYDLMGYAISKPNLRAALECDLKLITEGRKTKEEVLREQVNAYKTVFIDALENVTKLDEALSKYYGAPTQAVQNAIQTVQEPILECSCKSQMVLRTKKDGNGYYISCRSFPDCKNSLWFPPSVLEARATTEFCQNCHPKRVRKIRFKFERGSVLPSIPLNELKQCLNLTIKTSNTQTAATQQPQRNHDNGYNNSRTLTTTNSNTNQRRNNTSSTTSNTGNSRANTTATTSQSFLNDSNNENNPFVCFCGTTAALKTVRKEGLNQGRQFYACSSSTSCQFFTWADGNGNANDTSNNNNNSFGGRPSGGGGGYGNNSSGFGGGGRSTGGFNSNGGGFGGSASGSGYTNNRGGGGAGGDTGTGRQSFNDQSLSASDVICGCGIALPMLTVQKEGPNKGKKFYSCNACHFWQWKDGPSAVSGTGTSDTGNSYGSRSTQNQGSHKSSGFSSQRASSKSDGAAPGKSRKCGVCGQAGHNRKNCPTLNDEDDY